MTLPVLRLRVSGYCSPIACANTDEELQYGQAACALQSVPIVWYRKVMPKLNVNINTKKGSTISETKSDAQPFPHKDEKELVDKSIPLFLKRQMTFLQNISTTSPKISNSNKKTMETSPNDTNERSETYARFEGVLSLCDTESGPALELRSVSKATEQILETHHLSDFDDELDILSMALQRKEEKPVDENRMVAAMERIIPLDIIDYAARGGTWDWANMINVGRGTLDCGIKVYSSAEKFQLIGSGKKVLLFDIVKGTKLTKEDTINHINALVKWNRTRLEYLSQVDNHTEIRRSTQPNLCC